MHKLIKFISTINIDINLVLEDIAFSMTYTKFLLRYYIGGFIHFASECYKHIKNPANSKILATLFPGIFNKISEISEPDTVEEKPHDCEHCEKNECSEHVEPAPEPVIISRQEEIEPEKVDNINQEEESNVKPVFNSELIHNDIFIKYSQEELNQAKVISNNPDAENDLEKIMKAIAITEEIVSTLQDREIHYDNLGKLNKLMLKMNKLYERAKVLSKEESLKKKREMAESLMDDILNDDVVNK